MTEVPEHLLRRSRERREALGLAPPGGEGGTSQSAAPTPSPSEPPAAVPAETGGTEPVETPAAAAPTAPEPALPTYVAPAAPRSGIPAWMLPVLVLLPFWAIVYMGAFGTPKKTVALTGVALGAQVYSTKGGCAGCHGANGEGGVGPALVKGDALLTFPNEADHVKWVEEGSQTKAKGTPYGDPNRPGGQRTVQVSGMPSFKGTLTDAEIKAVVEYEREAFK